MLSFVLRHTDWQWNKQVSFIFLAPFIHGIRRIDNFLSLKMQKEIKCVHCFILQLMELLNFILIGSIRWEMQSMNKKEYTKAAGINKHDRSIGCFGTPQTITIIWLLHFPCYIYVVFSNYEKTCTCNSNQWSQFSMHWCVRRIKLLNCLGSLFVAITWQNSLVKNSKDSCLRKTNLNWIKDKLCKNSRIGIRRESLPTSASINSLNVD